MSTVVPFDLATYTCLFVVWLSPIDIVMGGLLSWLMKVPGRTVRRWYRRRISASWPSARITVLSGQVQQRQDSYITSIAYSYLAAGDRYGGHYECEYDTEKQANQALQRLLASAPMVRYKPGQPDTKILDPEEISY